MAEADAEHRQARIDELPDLRHGIDAGRRRIARPVRQEHAVGLARQHLLGGRRRRHHRELAAGGGELAQDVALQAVVDGDDMEAWAGLLPIAFVPPPLGLVPAIALAARHILGEVEPDHAGEGGELALQRRKIELAVRRVRDHRVRHALLADQRGQRARVDAGDGDDAARLQPVVELLRRAVVGGARDRRAQHAAAHAGRRGEARRLDVLGVGADIADMGEGEGDDLPGIRRVGQDLLIAGHGGVEAHLADGDAGRARALALDHGAVGEHEQRRWRAPRPRGRSPARVGSGPLRPACRDCRSSAFVVPPGRGGWA